MTLDGVLTLVAIALAAMAMTPPAKWLGFKLRFGFIDWTILVVALLLVLYLQFYSFFSHLGLALHRGVATRGLSPRAASFLVVVVATGLLIIRLRFTRLRRRRVHKFAALVEQLISERRYSEITTLLESHLSDLRRITRSNFFFPRLKKRLLSLDPERPGWLLLNNHAQDGVGNAQSWYEQMAKKLPSGVRQGLAALGKRLPGGESGVSAANGVLRNLLLSDQVVSHIAVYRPQLGLTVLDADFSVAQGS